MNLAVAADHAGVDLKRELVLRLRREHRAEDLGARTRRAVDYPDVARAVAQRVREGRAERGLLVCGSALGVCVAANKVAGIRAGTCHDTYSARQGVEHDDLNVLCLGARVVGTELAWEVVEAFLRARFSGAARHRRRLAKIRTMEEEAGLRGRLCGGGSLGETESKGVPSTRLRLARGKQTAMRNGSGRSA